MSDENHWRSRHAALVLDIAKLHQERAELEADNLRLRTEALILEDTARAADAMLKACPCDRDATRDYDCAVNRFEILRAELACRRSPPPLISQDEARTLLENARTAADVATVEGLLRKPEAT